jgi:hypothetical protein
MRKTFGQHSLHTSQRMQSLSSTTGRFMGVPGTRGCGVIRLIRVLKNRAEGLPAGVVRLLQVRTYR